LANYPSVLHYEMLHDPQTAAAAIKEHIKRLYEGYVQAYGDGIVGGGTGDYTSASYHPLVYARAPCSSTP